LNRLLLVDSKALGLIRKELGERDIFKIPSGTECWTWIILN